MQAKVLLTPFWIIAATFVGIGDTLFLAYYQYLGITPTCALLHGCERVLTSPYSKFMGLPLAYFGLVFYAYMLALAILVAIDPTSRGLRFGLLMYATIGLLSSIMFESIQIFLIGAICMYCAISALTTATLFGLALWHFSATKERTIIR